MEQLTKVAELEVSYIPICDWNNQPQITTSAEAFKVIRQHFAPNTIFLQEQFVVLYLNRNNRVMAAYRCSAGGITGTVADIRLILATALKVLATGMVISHNHPSGNLKPSRADEELTRKIKESAKLMDITLVDHLILTGREQEYFSFADDGIL